MASLGRHSGTILGIALPLLLIRPFIGGATAAAAPAAQGAAAARSAAADVIARTNAIRKEAGCAPVEADERLRAIAQAHASEMARHRYLDHEDRDGTSSGERIGSAGYRGVTGENLAHGYPGAAEVMGVWMRSAGHRANIEDCAFTHIGVGYAPNGDYWVQDFGG
jgi:uncharacterized protein YkwD